MPDPGPVVANAGPLIVLAAVGQLDLVGRLYAQVLVPEAVFQEITVAGAGRAGAAELPAASWAVRTPLDPPPDPRLGEDLGRGETEAITIAVRRSARLVLLDDRRARQVARVTYGLSVKGAPGILVASKKAGFVTSVRPFLDQMRAKGYFLAPAVVDRALREAGE
jgi:predicted nucleic acid-binding protein